MELNRREASFRQWLKTHLQISGFFVTNIESSTKNGIPDSYVVVDFTPVWLELKVDEEKIAPLIRKEQRIWGMKHERAGGKAWFLHYVEKDSLCYFYKNPVEEVRVSGKYLQILDAPVAMCRKHQVQKFLYALAKGLPLPNL